MAQNFTFLFTLKWSRFHQIPVTFDNIDQKSDVGGKNSAGEKSVVVRSQRLSQD